MYKILSSLGEKLAGKPEGRDKSVSPIARPGTQSRPSSSSPAAKTPATAVKPGNQRGGDTDGAFRINLSIDELRKRVKGGGTLLTGDGGAIKLSDQQRRYMALFDNGLFLVAERYERNAHVRTTEVIARQKGYNIFEKIAAPFELLEEVYDSAGNLARKGGSTAGLEQKEKEILALIKESAKRDASDIHIIVKGDRAIVRIRTDGILYYEKPWSAKDGYEFLHAANNMASEADGAYDVREYNSARISSEKTKQLAQFGVQALRLQFAPLGFGGRYGVMQLLYKTRNDNGTIAALGYSPGQLALISQITDKPQGVFVLAGPTGQGKSTTLNRVLKQMMRDATPADNPNGAYGHKINLITVEDPIEYELEGASQLPINNAKDPTERKLKFLEAIRAAMRLDPEIIMIGECRDYESASLAAEASETGHQVFTTIHAQSAIGAMTRMRGIKIEEFRLFDRDVFSGFASQRLVRTLCPHCRIPFAEAYHKKLVDEDTWSRVARVCDVDGVFIANEMEWCNHCMERRGFAGRSVVAEILAPDDEFMAHMSRGDRKKAFEHWTSPNGLGGMTLMRHAIERMKRGEISPSEIRRVLGPVTEAPEAQF